MITKIGNVVIDETYYSGKDQYSDGDIEDRLLDVCKNNYEQDVLYHSSEWPILYHLSDMRENLLEWYPFSKEDEILEVGSGCGALTGLLSRKAKSVTCIELSKKRSMINAYRNKDCKNVTIFVGNFEDVNIEKKYDYITLIGVWEYSNLYVSGNKPYIKILEKLKSYLKPTGKLIIAIENKMGLKYWNGAPEDHDGKLYTGLNDYVDNNRIRTFSHNDIEKICKEVGFEKVNFYYPMADYKLPDVIYSDENMPTPGCIRYYRHDYSNIRMYNFNDAAVCDQLCNDEMFAYFANSFLVVCGEEEYKVIYAKYCRDRKKKFRISTQIRKDKKKKYIIKKALENEANKHISQFIENEKKFRSSMSTINIVQGKLIEEGVYQSEYVEGINLEAYLYQYRIYPNIFIIEVKNIIEKYLKPKKTELWEFVKTEEYEKLFGNNLPSNSLSLKVTNIDMIFSNLIIDKEGKLYCIDNEWVYDFSVPYSYCMWRILNNLYSQYTIYLKNTYNREDFLLNFGFEKQDLLIYSAMEKNFCMHVYGKDKKESYLDNYRKPIINSRISWF